MLWMIAAGLCVISVSSLVKFLGEHAQYHAVQIGFVRYVWGMVLIAPVLLKAVRFRPTRREFGYLFGRGFCQYLGVAGWFYAVTTIPLADATAINYMQPIFATLLAVMLLSERISYRRVLAIVVAMIGGFIILRPGFRELQWGHWFMLFGAFTFASGALFGKRAAQTVAPDIIIVYLTVISFVGLGIPVAWVWKPMDLYSIMTLGVIAVFATLAHYCMIKSFQAAPLSVTQPMTFLQLVWSTMIGVAFFAEAIDPYVVLGAAMVVMASAYIAYREGRVKRG